jgi:hypothetical protein
MPHPVDDDPVMASAIGRCSNNWTHVETTLSRLFCYFTATKFEIAVTVFSFFKTSRTQRDVLRKLAQMAPFMTEELNKRLKEVLRTYLALAEERNELLHNPIGSSIENEVYIMLRRPPPRPGELPYHAKPISPTEIDALSQRITVLNSDLRDLEQTVFRATVGTFR